MSIIVVKVGGSLFDWPPAPQLVDRWLKNQPSKRFVVLGGGGHFVDEIRQRQLRLGLSDELAHDQAIEQLKFSAQLLKRWLPRASQCDRLEQLGVNGEKIAIFDASKWALTLRQIPKTWQFTSDSLAAILAERLQARELVLLKSRSPSTPNAIDDPELCDPLFSRYLRTPCRIVNLRQW